MKIIKKAADYWNSQKNKPLFKGKVLAVIVTLAALVINFALPIKESEANGESTGTTSTIQQDTQSKEESKPESDNYKIHIGTSNIIALGIGIAALAAVKIKREKDLNGRHDKVEKNNKEDE